MRITEHATVVKLQFCSAIYGQYAAWPDRDGAGKHDQGKQVWSDLASMAWARCHVEKREQETAATERALKRTPSSICSVVEGSG